MSPFASSATEIIRDFESSPLHSSFVDRNDDFPSRLVGSKHVSARHMAYGIRNRVFVHGRATSVSFPRRPAKNKAAERNVLHNRHNFVDKARRKYDQRGRTPARAVNRKFVLGSTRNPISTVSCAASMVVISRCKILDGRNH